MSRAAARLLRIAPAIAHRIPLPAGVHIAHRVVARIGVGLVGEVQRRPPQRIARDEATQRRVVRSHAHPGEAVRDVVAHTIAAIVAVGIRPAVGEALRGAGQGRVGVTGAATCSRRLSSLTTAKRKKMAAATNTTVSGSQGSRSDPACGRSL